MATSFQCPNCSGPIVFEGRGLSVPCPYCGTTVIIPEELRSPTATHPGTVQTLDLSEILAEMHAGRKINAIKLYRELTAVGLKEAKDAVEQLAASGWNTTQQSTVNFQVITNPAIEEMPPRASQVNKPVLIWVLAVFLLAIIAGAVLIFNTPDGPVQSLAPLLLPTQTFIPSPTPFAQPALAFGDEGTGAGYFKDARSVAVDAQGRIFIGDYIPGRIQAFTADGTFIWQHLTEGDTDYVISLAASLDGKLYAAVGRSIEVFDTASGKLLDQWEPTEPFSNHFDALALTPKGEVLAVEEDKLVQYDPQGNVNLRVGGVDEAFLKLVGVKEASVRITGIAVDGSGNIYISTDNNYILKLAKDGSLIDRLNGEGSRGVDAFAVDGQGRIAWGYGGKIVVTDGEGRHLGEFTAPFMRDMAFNLKGELVAVRLSAPIIQVYSFSGK